MPYRSFKGGDNQSPIQCIRAVFPVGANQNVYTGVAGKIFRIMGYQAQGVGGVSDFVLKTTFGGALLGITTVPTNAAGLVDRLPIVESGYSETGAGETVLIDVTTNPLSISLFYSPYVP